MSRVLGMLARIYRTVIPAALRRSPLVARMRWRVHERLYGHDAIYNSAYFASDVDETAANSAPAMAASIRCDLDPHTAVDVGCGSGALLDALRAEGLQVLGYEYSEAALARCRTRGLEVRKFNLEREVPAGDRPFGVAISLEVAEHLPEKRADSYVAFLARLAPAVVFSAAPPGQGGRDHVNEQPQSYWIAKFQRLGFAYDQPLTERWRDAWRASTVVAPWYYTNLMVFRGSPTHLLQGGLTPTLRA